MEYCSLYMLTFAVTALWDIVLRHLSENFKSLPHAIRTTFPFIEYLTPYFKVHTVLGAALIAGFIGATYQMMVVKITPFPKCYSCPSSMTAFLTVSFVVSALYGFLIKLSGLFPILVKTYYKGLEAKGGILSSMLHDGTSGLIVQLSLLMICSITNF